MIARFLTERDADTVVLDFDLFLAEQAKLHRVSQPAIIAALRPRISRESTTSLPSNSKPDSPFIRLESTTPQSQPEANSKPHAPAADAPAAPASAQTDGEVSPPCSSPSVKPIPMDAGEAQFRDPLDWEDEDGARSVDEIEAEAKAAKLTPATEPTKSSPAVPSAERLRAKIAACHAENPTWPARMIGRYLGESTQKIVNVAISAGINLPTQTEYDASNVKRRNAELARAKPQTPVEPAPAPQVDQAPQSTSLAPVLPPVERDVTDALHKPKRAPQGRFYLVVRGDLTDTRRYVHQSLQPDPSGKGPMLTTDRRWAWFNDIVKFRGAAKLWPQIANMRKEAANA